MMKRLAKIVQKLFNDGLCCCCCVRELLLLLLRKDEILEGTVSPNDFRAKAGVE
jgi:hypothetical protein